MKKKNYRLLSLLFVLPLLLTGCGGKGGEGQGGGGGGSQPSGPAVTGVTIAEPEDKVVLDGTRATLKASVAGEEGVSQKVKWSSSDSTVATVTNGVVNFLKVAEQKKVIITATSDADSQFKDDVEFTVEHSPFDLKNSRGNPDTSCYLEDGEFIIEDPQDIALVYADVHDTRWYVEATIAINQHDMTDQWPKFGFMASDRDDGMWCYENSHQFFYYADTPSAASTWNSYGIVGPVDTLNDWNWGGLITGGSLSPAIKKGEAFKMGLMRDGNRFYAFYGKATDLTLGMVAAFEYADFGENANYVWVGGWKTAVVVSDPKCIVGDQIDSLYNLPENISLKSNEETVYLGNSYQIEITTEGLWDRNKLTFTSDNEEIATVDAKGLITANATTAGTAHITVALAGTELSAQFTFHVTDDLMYKVVLDGKMEDAIWTNKVKTNRYMLKKSNSDYVYIYGSKNSRGLYLFMDYTVGQTANCNPNQWWTWENVEFRLADDDKAWSAQYWVSSMNGGSFVSVGDDATAGYKEKAEQVYYKALELGTDNLYHGAFEMFVPFGDDQVTKGQATYACFGWAPKTGWQQGYNWYATIDDNSLNITSDGFVREQTNCEAGHHYGDWVVDLQPTCSATGHRYKECSWCGHRLEETLPINPDAHQFDYEHATVTTPSTCSTHGVGTAVCTLCGAEDNTELPFDYTNHSDADYPTTHTHCSACGIGSYLTNATGDTYDRSGVGGPWDKSGWYDAGLFSGDFTFVFEFHMQGGCGGNSSDWGSFCWRTVLPFVYKEGYAGDADGHFFRMDWCGFGGGSFLTNISDGSDVGGLYPNGWDVFNNSDIKLTYTKVGGHIAINWTITCCATEGTWAGVVINNYNQSCDLIDPTAKVGIALASEFTLCTITKAELSRA